MALEIENMGTILPDFIIAIYGQVNFCRYCKFKNYSL